MLVTVVAALRVPTQTVGRGLRQGAGFRRRPEPVFRGAIWRPATVDFDVDVGELGDEPEETVLTDADFYGRSPDGVYGRSPDGDDDEDVTCYRGLCVVDEGDVAALSYDDLMLLEAAEAEQERILAGLSAAPSADVDEAKALDAGRVANLRRWSWGWPRALLLGCALAYGSNFPLGRLMNESLPPAATSSVRFGLAAVALLPFLGKLKPNLVPQVGFAGIFVAMAYIGQSIALDTEPASTVAFLGALTVIVTPVLAAVFQGKKLGIWDAPQTWVGATLALTGVGILELLGVDGVAFGVGDLWAILQSLGFGVSFFMTELMMEKEPDQALPITAGLVAVTAVIGAAWAGLDGMGMLPGAGNPWLLAADGSVTFGVLTGLVTDAALRPVAAAMLWTSLFTVCVVRWGEATGLGKVTSAESAVLLATEPLWAALFAAVILGEGMGVNDVAGGALIVAACLTSGAKPQFFRSLFQLRDPSDAAAEEA